MALNRRDTIKVHGAKELRREIKKAERNDLKDELKQAHKEVAALVAKESERNAPKRSGLLASSIRGLGSISRASVAAGGAAKSKARYAGVVHYGTPDSTVTGYGRSPQPFITDAVKSEFKNVIRILEERYSDIGEKLSSR